VTDALKRQEGREGEVKREDETTAWADGSWIDGTAWIDLVVEGSFCVPVVVVVVVVVVVLVLVLLLALHPPVATPPPPFPVFPPFLRPPSSPRPKARPQSPRPFLAVVAQ